MTVGWSYRLFEPHFPHRAETWEQKPTELGNILTIPNLRGENMGIGNLPSLPHNLSQFPPPGDCGLKFQTCYILCFFCTFVKPIQSANILAILKLGVGRWVQGNPSLSSSQPLSIFSSSWLWVELSNLLCFYAFSTLLLLAFWFSLVKAPLAFCSL